MSTFRLQNNTPKVYTAESRDFQLLARAMDALHGGIMGQIPPILSINRPRTMYDNYLSHYSSSVGFFTRRDIDSKVLRYILAAFPYLIKNKGTKKGILGAVNTIIKAENNTYNGDGVSVEIINDPSYTVVINTTYEIYNRNALEELLKYIVPAGYTYRFEEVLTGNKYESVISTEDSILTAIANPPVSGARSVASIPNIDADGYNYAGNAFYTGDAGVENREAASIGSNTVISVSDIEPPPANNTEEQNEEE